MTHRQRIDFSTRQAGFVYDAIVGDDSCGFWVVDHAAECTTSYIGVGRPSDLPEPQQTASWPEAGTKGREFRGGWIGWIGYDKDDSCWLAVEKFVTFEHESGKIDAHTVDSDLTVWAAEVETLLLQHLQHLQHLHNDGCESGEQTTLTAQSRDSPEHYRRIIASAQDAIRAGDAYQLCVTTRFSVRGDFDPRHVFRRMLEKPGRRSALIRGSSRALVVTSPEAFLSISPSRSVSTSPIKGTRPRGKSASEDRALRRELKSDPKERAENVMIVDLMRNDLARVCRAGSVTTPRLLHVETHPHVHQLVSEVTGVLEPRVSLRDVLASTFPAGSMTGAPKQSAINLLANIESGPRGRYAGCFGWVNRDGSAELSMTIRSVAVDRGIAYVGAGGGITIDSEPEREIAEVALKAQAPLAALGARLPEEWENARVRDVWHVGRSEQTHRRGSGCTR